MLLLDLARLERGEPLQAEVEDGLRLLAREVELRNEAVSRGVGVARAPDQLDHGVEVRQRDEQPLEDVCARLSPAQLELRATHDHVALVVDVVADELGEPQGARNAIDQRDHVRAEGGLHRGVLVELVERDLVVLAPLQLDHEPDAGLVRLVAQVRDLLQPALLDPLGDLLDQARPVVAAVALGHLVRHLGDDDGLLALPQRLDVRPRADDDPPAARLVSVLHALPADDDPAGREVRALDVLHQADGVDVGIVDVGHHGIHGLAQVVRRDVRGHADRDPRRAVDEQVREPCRQYERLALGVVVVRAEVDRVGVDVAQHLRRDAREPRLCVSHGRRRVVVERAEVALAVDQRVAHGEVLREPDERVVDRGVSVRVEGPHDLADNAGALPVRAPRLEAAAVHRVQDAAVNGLEAVADVRQRPPHDHAHRVIEVRRAHLLL